MDAIHVSSILLILLAPKRTLLNANRQVSLLIGQIYGNFIWIIEPLVWGLKSNNLFFGKTLFLKERKRIRPRRQKCFFCLSFFSSQLYTVQAVFQRRVFKLLTLLGQKRGES